MLLAVTSEGLQYHSSPVFLSLYHCASAANTSFNIEKMLPTILFTKL